MLDRTSGVLLQYIVTTAERLVLFEVGPVSVGLLLQNNHGFQFRFQLCGLNSVTTQTETFNKSPMIVVTAHYYLSLIHHHLFTLLYFSQIFQLLCILHFTTLFFNSKSSSHVYRAAPMLFHKIPNLVVLQGKKHSGLRPDK
jgi:hypothetical protein